MEKYAAPPVHNKLPKCYKPNKHCAFHSDASGHDTENCFIFKGKVQEHVILGLTKFGDMQNVTANPFPEHGALNVITEDENLIMDVLKMKTLLVLVHLKLSKAGILEQDHEKCSICLRDSKGCFDVHKDIQMLISNGVLQVSGEKKNDEVYVIVSVFRKPKAFEIFCPPREGISPANSATRLNFKMLTPFPYKFDKVVPWEYAPTTTVNGVEKPLVNNKIVTNIVDASGLTSSGRVFTSVGLRSGKPDNGKALLVIPKRRPVLGVDVEEFLRLIRNSHYKVVDHLLQI